MNDSNDTSGDGSEVNTSSVGTNRRTNKRSNRSNSVSARRSKRVKTQTKNNRRRVSAPNRPPNRPPNQNQAMGSHISAENTSNEDMNQMNESNEETLVRNNDQNGVNSEDTQTTQPNDVPNDSRRDLSNLCIDLTEDDSVVNENNAESDSEIQLISTFVRDSDLCIVRDIKRRNRLNRTDRSRSPLRQPSGGTQTNDIIELQDSQTDQNSINETTAQSGSTPIRKTIKCPVCLDDYSTFRVSGKQLVSTNCGHLFCDRCIKEVIKTSKSCPNCRKKIATQKSFHPIYL